MTNGYGPNKKGIRWKIVNLLLNLTARIIGFKRANADKHDEGYEKGGTEEDRIWCDTGFLRRLLIDCEGNKAKAFVAYLFYFAVRLLGRGSFNYKEKEKQYN